MQQDMMDCIFQNGLQWCIRGDTVTRRHLVRNHLQEALLDQILCTNRDFVLCTESLAPLGKIDHL